MIINVYLLDVPRWYEPIMRRDKIHANERILHIKIKKISKNYVRNNENKVWIPRWQAMATGMVFELSPICAMIEFAMLSKHIALEIII